MSFAFYVWYFRKYFMIALSNQWLTLGNRYVQQNNQFTLHDRKEVEKRIKDNKKVLERSYLLVHIFKNNFKTPM